MLIHDDLYQVRNVTGDDAEAILEVYRQCEDFLALGTEPTASMSMVFNDIEASQREGRDFRGIYNSSDEMVGIIDFMTCNYDGNPHVALISLLMIALPFRRQGTGTKIIELLERDLKKHYNIITIISAVQVNNLSAQRFWQKNGYRIVSGPVLQADKTTVFQLRKDLS